MSLEGSLLDPMRDHFGLIELYETVFGHTATPAMWYWKYVPSWTRRHYCYVGRVDDKVIGYFGAVPLRGLKDGKEIPYFQLADLMVHPDYRRKYDYFEIGSKHILTDINETHPEHLVYGFSDHRAFRFLKKRGLAGFIEKAQHRYLRLADTPPAAEARFCFEPWDWKSAHIDQVWELHRPRIRAGLIRDADYLFWRYGCHPLHGYKLLGVLQDGEPVGFAVVGSDRPGEHGRAKESPVVDLLLPPDDTGRILQELCRHWGNDLMLWMANHLHPDLGEQVQSGTHCYHFVKDSAVDTEYLSEHLYYTMGDVDWW